MAKFMAFSKMLNAGLPKDLWILLTCYCVFYAVYKSGWLITFDSSDILYYTHFLNPAWLKSDLASSLWYLHSQPPFMNLLIGLIFKLWPEHYRLAFDILYLVAGISAVILLFFALMRLNISRIVRLTVLLFLYALPTLFRYQAWLYSAHLEFCLCAGLVYMLASAYARPDRCRRYLVGIFSIAAVLGLIRGQWHMFVWLGLAGVLAVLMNRQARRTVMVVMVVCMLPLMAWYSKNLYIFGFWGPSSWLGANLSQVALQIIGPNELAAMQSKGLVSSDFPADFEMKKILRRVPPETLPEPLPHISLGAYKTEQPEREPPHNHRPRPELRQLNYIGMIASARQDMTDALTIIRRYPLRYVIMTLHKMLITPAIPTMISYSETMTDFAALVPEQMRYALFLGSFLLYGCTPYILLVQGRRRLSEPQWKFFLTVFYLTMTMLAISCALNGEEQERMRWSIAPAYLCYVAMVVEMFYRRWMRKTAV